MKLRRTNTLKIKIGIFAASICAICYLSFSPVIASIAAAFPETDISLVQLVMTIPSFMFILFSPLTGKLTAYIRKKTLLKTALGLYLVGGLFPFFFHSSIWLILTGSVLVGCGSGILTPVMNAVICDCIDMEKRPQIMGLSATFTALGALLFIYVSGQLVMRFGWTYCFLVFLLIIPALVIVEICLPTENAASYTEGSKGSGFEINPYIAALFLLGFVFFTIQNAFNTNSSLYISELDLGGTDVASVISMGNTIGGIVGGALFGFVVGKLKDQVGSFAFAAAGVGFLLAYFLQLFFPVLLGGALVGVAFAFYNSTGTYLMSKHLKPENNAFTVSVYMAVVNVGSSISPIVVNTLSGIIDQGIAPRYLMSGIILLVCMVLSVIVNQVHSQRSEPVR